ncbi:MAG: oligosaccharide flippase family protein [Mariniphaga sp.]|nr:oligosaccharide flippase family protein [Mariniphaga sp.]
MIRKRINSVSAFQLYQLIRYVTLGMTGIVFAKTSLTREAIGDYETFIFLAGAVSFFWLNGLMKALLPLSSDQEHSRAAIFSSFVLISVFSLSTAILIYFIHPAFSGFLLDGRDVPELRLLIIYLIFGVPSNLAEYFYLIRKKNKSLVVYAVVSFSIQFLLVVLPVILSYSIRWAMYGLVFSSVLRYVWLWVMFIRFSAIHFSFGYVKAHLRLGIPLVAATLLSGSAQFVDGFIVTSRFDSDTFAVFRYGARELPLATLLANALNNALLPAFGKREDLQTNLAELKNGVTRLMHFLFPMSAILLLIAHPVFPIVFNPAFTESATIFNIYLLLIVSRVLMPQTILNGLRQTGQIMVASLLELILNVSLSLLFVRIWGLPGIALATFIAYLFEKMYLVLMVRWKLKIHLSEYHPVNHYFYYSIGLIAIFIFTEFVF